MGEETPPQMHGDLQGQRSSEETIFVSVRLRPLNDKEMVRNGVSDWECINKNTIVFKHSMPERSMFPAAYTFDRVFGCDCPTKEVYLEGAKEIALSVLNGINSTIFAYGQTSSGKTYTMSGITEFAMADIYDYVDKRQEREFVLKFSAMEIYNEHVRDLLSSDCTPLRLLDDPERGTVVEKLIEEILRDKEHLEELLSICEAQRQIGETSLNETSSRSHQILRLTVESSSRDYSGEQNSSTLTATVNFVDLSGSERASQTLSAGARLKEGCHINRSLLTLGTVIRKLSKGRNGQHIPYRDSKLTRILQNSLGANGRTAIICTMSPASSHVEQSRNTLLFASCAKEVTTNAQVNLVMSDKALVKQLQRELARLESEMKSLVSSPGRGADSTKLLKEKEILIEQMDKEIKELTRQRDLAQSRVENLLRSVEEIQTPKQNEYLAMATPNLANPRRLAAFNQLRTFDEPNTPNYNQYLELSVNPDDNFLLDDSTPKFIGLDPCQDWEEVAQKTHGESTDLCKEVRCIEIEKPCIKTNAKAYDESFTDSEEKEEKLVKIRPMHEDAASLPQKVDVHSSPMNVGETDNENDVEIEGTNLKLKADFSSVIVGDNEGQLAMTENEEKSATTGAVIEDSVPYAHKGDTQSQMNTNETYDALRGRIQELQRTIKYLINLQGVEQSPTSSDTSGSSSRSISRSRSCRAVLNTATSSPLGTPPTGFERNSPDIPRGICQNLSALKYDSLNQNISSRTSLSCGSFDARTLKGLDVEDIKGIHEPNEGAKLQLEDQIGHGPVRKRTLSLDFATMEKGMTLQSNKQPEEDMEGTTSIHDFAPGSNGRPQSHLEKQLGDDSERIRTSTSLDFVPQISEMNPLSKKQSSEDLGHEVASKAEESLEKKKDTTEPASPSEFEIQQRKIIELWDACYEPLIHRTYFFLLFKGDPSDAVYMEVELRRLSFLKDSLPSGTNAKNDNRNATIMSSMKDLNRERAMLSRQVPKKFSRREREELYKKWGIELNTKRRARQLARRLWTDTKDMEHIKQSAALVAKLIGFVEPSQAPKEVFGLSFLPRNFTRRSYSWK